MFEKIQQFFKPDNKISDEEAKKIEEAKKLNETADEMMKGDIASPEVSESEKETTEEEKE